MTIYSMPMRPRLLVSSHRELTFTEKVAASLQDAAIAQGVSMTLIAAQTGLSVFRVHRALYGPHKAALGEILRIAETLGFEPNELLQGATK